MQDLRETAFSTEEIRYLPYLFQGACLQGRDPGRKESKLVGLICEGPSPNGGAGTARGKENHCYVNDRPNSRYADKDQECEYGRTYDCRHTCFKDEEVDC